MPVNRTHSCCSCDDVLQVELELGLVAWDMVETFFPYRSNQTLSQCLEALRQSACVLCCSTSSSQFVDTSTGVLSLCSSSCDYLYTSCGPVFGVAGSTQQDFCSWALLQLVYPACRATSGNGTAGPITSLRMEPFGSECLDLTLGAPDELLARAMAYLGGGVGALSGLYYICFAARFPMLSLFLQTFAAVGGVCALSSIATLLTSTASSQLTAAVIVPLVVALLPALSNAYLVVRLRRLGFFVMGATAGLQVSGVLLALVYQAVQRAIPSAAQYTGLVVGLVLVVLGGCIGVYVGEFLLRISFLLLGCSILAVSLSTYVAGPQMNVFALFVDPQHFGCATISCWLSVGGWLALIVLVFVVRFCCRCHLPTRSDLGLSVVPLMDDDKL